MVFTQGMEISVLLQVTDFLGWRWASSLIREVMRPIASRRCVMSLRGSVPRWYRAGACKVWTSALFIHVSSCHSQGKIICFLHTPKLP